MAAPSRNGNAAGPPFVELPGTKMRAMAAQPYPGRLKDCFYLYYSQSDQAMRRAIVREISN